MHSIIGSWLTVLVNALDSYGIDGEEFLLDRNIQYPQSSDPSCRIELATMRQLWLDAVEVTKDPGIGLRAGTFVAPNTFSTLGLAMSSCCSVKDMLDLLCRYLQIFNTGCSMQLIEEGQETTVCIHLPKGASGQLLVSHYGIDASVSAIFSVISSYNIKRLTPKGVTLPYAEPENASLYSEFFDCQVAFGGDDLLLQYESVQIQQTIPGGNEAIAKSAEALVITALEQIKNDGITRKVRTTLIKLLGESQATIKNVASALNTSPRTLHRRLDEKNTSFRELLDSVRQEQAMEQMKNTRLTVEDIGLQLGFSSHSNYSRAFKRWTGITPRDFRNNLVQLTA